ncbi:histidine kinase [Flavobacterium sp. SUN046]|uniref:sensor histidine kinase n=1 Tax=Flavobacterium sp. SUN046 TaxID=3002440 RepID=UPI002DBF3668|nr:histidine kinase [Flavobacterium sp. SUN046]MEC4050689.1 histidine kinase [Flavobacterium sp. SUN046]
MVYVLEITIGLLLLLVGVLFWRLTALLKEKQEIQKRFTALQDRVDGLQLDNLESRLNPHLFKNILNSIQSHAYQTFFALDKLANVLDYILYDSQQKLVTPREEIAFAINLIEINKIKISPLFELRVKTKVNDNEKLFDQKLLAPLISIDLIENAFKHADLQSADAFISVLFEFKDHCFSLTVSNKISDKKAMKKERSGIGATTLEQRLRIIYKNNFQLEKHTDNSIYTVHLKINLLDYKNQMLITG